MKQLTFETRTTPEEQNAFLAAEYAEAVRYMDNARDALAKAKKDGNYYTDKKYVRMACGTAYSGVLVALDAWLVLKGVLNTPKKIKQPKNPKKLDKKRRKSIDFYTDSVAKIDGKLLDTLNGLYEILHLRGYYDGNGDGRLISAGFGMAEDVINRIKPYKI